MKIWSKVVTLLLINIILAGGMLYFFDYMRILNLSTLINEVSGKKAAAPRIEDPFLLEREELSKKWELLNTESLTLSNTILSVQESNNLLQTEQSRLQEERQAFLNEQALAAQKQQDENSYNVKITEVATQISGMPPQTAAELLNLQDDLQVVDIFKKMEELAAANGQASTVPFLLTLMERDKAARIQSLMLVPSYQ